MAAPSCQTTRLQNVCVLQPKSSDIHFADALNLSIKLSRLKSRLVFSQCCVSYVMAPGGTCARYVWISGSLASRSRFYSQNARYEVIRASVCILAACNDALWPHVNLLISIMFLAFQMLLCVLYIKLKFCTVAESKRSL